MIAKSRNWQDIQNDFVRVADCLFLYAIRNKLNWKFWEWNQSTEALFPQANKPLRKQWYQTNPRLYSQSWYRQQPKLSLKTSDPSGLKFISSTPNPFNNLAKAKRQKIIQECQRRIRAKQEKNPLMYSLASLDSQVPDPSQESIKLAKLANISPGIPPGMIPPSSIPPLSTLPSDPLEIVPIKQNPLQQKPVAKIILQIPWTGGGNPKHCWLGNYSERDSLEK